MVRPIGIRTCGPDRGATDQSERDDNAAAPVLARRVVVHLVIVRIHGGAPVRIATAVVRGRLSARGLFGRACMIGIEPLGVRRYKKPTERRAEPAARLPGRFPARAPLDLGGDRVPVAPERTG